jgi:hypothetical protein
MSGKSDHSTAKDRVAEKKEPRTFAVTRTTYVTGVDAIHLLGYPSMSQFIDKKIREAIKLAARIKEREIRSAVALARGSPHVGTTV